MADSRGGRGCARCFISSPTRATSSGCRSTPTCSNIRAGLVLFDAGICPDQVHRHRDYYRGILRYVLDDDEYAQEPDEALPQQLKRLGFRA